MNIREMSFLWRLFRPKTPTTQGKTETMNMKTTDMVYKFIQAEPKICWGRIYHYCKQINPAVTMLEVYDSIQFLENIDKIQGLVASDGYLDLEKETLREMSDPEGWGEDLHDEIAYFPVKEETPEEPFKSIALLHSLDNLREIYDKQPKNPIP
jgi:hypothetical protein